MRKESLGKTKTAMNTFKAIKPYRDKIEQNLMHKSQILRINAKFKQDTTNHSIRNQKI